MNKNGLEGKLKNIHLVTIIINVNYIYFKRSMTFVKFDHLDCKYFMKG